jgi:hypothetical protein
MLCPIHKETGLFGRAILARSEASLLDRLLFAISDGEKLDP